MRGYMWVSVGISGYMWVYVLICVGICWYPWALLPLSSFYCKLVVAHRSSRSSLLSKTIDYWSTEAEKNNDDIENSSLNSKKASNFF